MDDAVAQRPAQLALGLDFSDLNGFDNFAVGDNCALVAALSQQLSAKAGGFSYLWSADASGKTHLLQAACRQASESGLRAIYIPLEQMVDRETPQMLDGLANVDVLALDEMDSVVGNRDWQQALYMLLYEARNAGTQVLIAGKDGAESLNLEIADLKTRLCWDGSWHVAPLNDEQLVEFLKAAAGRRGLELGDDAASYIVNHSSRDMKSLVSLLEKLDKASLAERRRLTTAFIKPFLEIGG